MEIVNKILYYFFSQLKIYSAVTLFIVSFLIVSCNLPQKNNVIIETNEPIVDETYIIETEEVVEIDPVIEKAQDFAAKYITGLARDHFSKPLAVKIINVWFLDKTHQYSEGGEIFEEYYFTYQLEINDNYEYYSNYFDIRSLDNVSSYISQETGPYKFGNYFSKGIHNDAKTEGISLDAEEIQKYYIENYQ